ncbi:MAG TPA: YitT family protein [Fusicatenibacter saccharivorans]|nr:YitT family protein [Fusicatenibacter saccharivorans]
MHHRRSAPGRILSRIASIVGTAALAALAAGGTAAYAADAYPSKPIRLVVPYPAGGGTDIIAMIIKKYSTMNISTALLVTDLIVVILAFLIFDTLTGLCSVLGLMAKTLLIDKTIERMKLNKFFTIISNNPQPICDFITKDLNHSATLYDAVGAYSDQQRTVILTVVDVKQAVYLQRFIHDTEPTAFIAITKSSEIIGKGFMSYI